MRLACMRGRADADDNNNNNNTAADDALELRLLQPARNYSALSATVSTAAILNAPAPYTPVLQIRQHDPDAVKSDIGCSCGLRGWELPFWACSSAALRRRQHG